MPPKKAPAGGPSKKNVEKKKEKVVEDKTFGLKNKKGAKQQKFVQQVERQVKGSQAKLDREKAEKDKKKADELDDLNKLLKPVTMMPKVGKDVDPKSVLCAFFKQGMCGKGAKCKFSHDLSIERKAEKRNVFVDSRETENADNMDNWDDTKLNEVVTKKHGEADKNKPKTAIICKYFLEALESSKYGWFWECPNGPTCIYRHALPPGYMLKKDKKKLDEFKEDEISLEELIEKERAALGADVTKITYDSFVAWKKRKIQEKRTKKAIEEKRKQTEFRAGKQSGLSGKDLFTFNPDLITQDDEDADEIHYETQRDEEEDEVVMKDVDESMFRMEEETEAEGPSIDINEDLFDADEIPDSDAEDSDGNGKGTSVETPVSNGIENLSLQAGET